MNWKVLGIEETKDKKQIKRAYLTKLKTVNPEEKPEEFKALRAAYEKAMELADLEDEVAEEKGSNAEEVVECEKEPVTEAEKWLAALKSIYFDMRKRQDPNAWKRLLQEEFCMALDTHMEAEEVLLSFFMDYFYLPQEIWQLLDEEFTFSSRTEELYEKYPREFVDYAILNGIHYQESVPFSYFEPGIDGKECEEYLHLYHRAKGAMDEERMQMLEKISELKERHPYGDLLLLRSAADHGEEIDFDRVLNIYEKYPNDEYIALEIAELMILLKNYELSQEICQKVLEKNDRSSQAKWNLALTHSKMEDYQKAVSMIDELIDMSGGDGQQIYQLNQFRLQWNEHLITQYSERLKNDPKNMKCRSELGWALLQNDRYKEAFDVVADLTDEEDPYDYYALCGQIYYYLERYQEAYDHVDHLIALLEGVENPEEESVKKHLKRLQNRKILKAHLLQKLGREEEAKHSFEALLEEMPEDTHLLTSCIDFYQSICHYKKAADLAENITKLMPNSYHGYFLMAKSYFKMYYDREAFEATNRALELNGGDLAVYLLKTRILIRNNALEAAQSELDFLCENGLKDNIGVRYCQALLLERTEGDHERLFTIYEEIVKEIEAGEYMDFATDVYYSLVCEMEEIMRLKNDVDLDRLLVEINKGLQNNSKHADLLMYKAWILTEKKEIDEAIRLYHEVEKQPEHGLNVERQLGRLYYKDLYHNADRSLYYYEKLLSYNEEDPENLFYAGMCHYYTGNLENAEKCFLKEDPLEEEGIIDAPYRLSFIYEAMYRYEDALKMAERVIDIVKNKEGDQKQYYLRKVQILQRMNRMSEAVELVKEIMNRYEYPNGYQLIYEIYKQAGMYEEAEEHIRQGEKENPLAAMDALICLDILRGNLEGAKKKYKVYRKQAKEHRIEWMDSFFALIDGKLEKKLKIFKKKLQGYSKDNRDGLSYTYMTLAVTAWRCGKMEEAKEYARLGCEQVDEHLKGFILNKAIYLSRKAAMLMVMGQKEEAYALIEEVRSMPLCQNCVYGKCKDIDIYESYMAAIDGDYERSMELAVTGLEHWPDEEDFIGHMNFLKKMKNNDI